MTDPQDGQRKERMNVVKVAVDTDFLCKVRKRWLIEEVGGRIPVYWCGRERVFFSHHEGVEYRCASLGPLEGTLLSTLEDDSELVYRKHIGFNISTYSCRPPASGVRVVSMNTRIEFGFHSYEMAEKENGRKFFRPFGSKAKGSLENVYGLRRCLYTTELWAELENFHNELETINNAMKYMTVLIGDQKIKYTHEHIFERLKMMRREG